MNSSGGINYTAITKEDALALSESGLKGVTGVFFFVNHSDYDGDWTGVPRDEVALWLQEILPFVPDDRAEDEKKKNDDDDDDDDNISTRPAKKRKMTLEETMDAFPKRYDIDFVKKLLAVFQEGKEQDLRVFNW